VYTEEGKEEEEDDKIGVLQNIPCHS